MASIYEDKSPSASTRCAFVLGLLAITGVVGWYLVGGGARRIALVAASVLYFLRVAAGVFVFARRRMGWPEVLTVLVWLAFIELLYAFLGARQTAPLGMPGFAGAALILIGSLLNSGSEWQRHLWKRRPENAGHLLTTGFARLSRHVNYFGDLVLFTGWALLSGSAIALLVPVVMLATFVFVHVPAQDRYLDRRYGEEYRAYAARTARLIPWLY